MAIELILMTREEVPAVCEPRVAEAHSELIAPAAVTVAEARYYESRATGH